jgi:hypothetical protein
MPSMNTKDMPTLPRWLTYQAAPKYCGLSTRTLQNYENAGLIVVANVIQPGSRRGRKLIDRESLDRLITGSIGVKTQVDICPKIKNSVTAL